MVRLAVEVVREVLGSINRLVEMAVQEPEARCEYGLGSSEHRRAKRFGCAEA